MSDHGQSQSNAENVPDWDAIARVLANESSSDEESRVRAWLAAHPADRHLVERLDEAARPALADVDVEAALKRVHARMQQPGARGLKVVRGNGQRPRRVYLVSALAVAAAAAFAAIMLKSPSNETNAPAAS